MNDDLVNRGCKNLLNPRLMVKPNIGCHKVYTLFLSPFSINIGHLEG